MRKKAIQVYDGDGVSRVHLPITTNDINRIKISAKSIEFTARPRKAKDGYYDRAFTRLAVTFTSRVAYNDFRQRCRGVEELPVELEVCRASGRQNPFLHYYRGLMGIAKDAIDPASLTLVVDVIQDD